MVTPLSSRLIVVELNDSVRPSWLSEILAPLGCSRRSSLPSSSNTIFRLALVAQVLTLVSAGEGIFPSAHQQPVQMGFEGSPPSTSSHTPSPSSGNATSPCFGPAKGTHGQHGGES